MKNYMMNAWIGISLIFSISGLGMLLYGCANNKSPLKLDTTKPGVTDVQTRWLPDDEKENIIIQEPLPIVKDESPSFAFVYFDFDRYDIRMDQEPALLRNIEKLKTYTNRHIVIEGHCDERGTDEYNMILGENRANSVRNFMVAAGINPGLIKTISYGESRPAALGHTEETWAMNRRVTFLVTPASIALNE